MDISCLPTELIEEVAKYLSLKDVVACSAVNRAWRRTFNQDRIWNKYCTFNKNYIKKQVTKRRNSKYLSGNCKSKKWVFRELQMEKNLIHGKYTVTQLNDDKFHCNNLVDVIDDDGNHWLFISAYSKSELRLQMQVWNVNNEEPVKVEFIEIHLISNEGIPHSQMKVIQNKLYYLVKQVCVVFEFSCPQYKLTYLFQLTCPYYGEFKSCVKMVCKPNMVLGFTYTSAHFQQSPNPWVQVWGESSTLLHKNYSTSEMKQMKAQMVPLNYFALRSLLEVKDGGVSDNVLLVSNYDSGEISNFSVLLFCTKTFQYTTLFVKRKVRFVSCELVNEVVIVFYYEVDERSIDRVPKLICCSTDGEVIYEPEVTMKPNYNILTANEGKEVLIIDPLGDVIVFDVFQQKEISKFRIRRGKRTFLKYIGTFLKNNLMIVNEQKRNKTVFAVWDFKRGKRLYDFKDLISSSDQFNTCTFTYTNSFRSPPKMFLNIDELSSGNATYYERKILVLSFL